MNEENLETLSAAVVLRAVEDYQAALVKKHAIEMELEKIEEFFTGSDFNLYTKISGKSLMEKLEKQVIENNYSLAGIRSNRQKINIQHLDLEERKRRGYIV